jgi:hypothetical protein
MSGYFYSNQPKRFVVQQTPDVFLFAPQDFLCEAFLFIPAS